MPTERPNILLVVLDTARAISFDQYRGQASTPTFGLLAAQGLLFEHAVSPAPWTLPAHVSLFSGLLPSEHGVMGDTWGPDELPDVRPVVDRVGERWLSRAAASAGYQTFGAVANLWVGRRTGFDSAFDHYVTRRGDVPDGPQEARTPRWRRRVPPPARRAKRLLETYVRLRAGNRDNGARRLVEDFESWFASRDRSAPFLAFFNFMEPHAPYLPPREHIDLSGRDRIRAGRLVSLLKDSADLMVPYNLRMRDLDGRDVSILRHLYEGELSYVDEAVGRLIEGLEASGDLDRTLVAVTADHGENVGEHHLLAHNMSLHETVLHVPLVLRGPGVPPGRREETVSSLGLHASLLEAITGSPQPGSLVSDPEPGARSEYESARHQVRALDRFLRATKLHEDGFPALAFSKGAAVYRGSHKAVASAGKVEVFDLSSDPGEDAPLPAPWAGDARLAAEEAAAAVEKLQETARLDGATSALDEEIRSHLEALGYL